MLTQFTKLRLLIISVHILGLWGLLSCWDVRWFGLFFLCHFLFLWIGQEMYVHRYLSHRSFQMSVGWQRLCAFLSIFNLFGTPIGIAATHVTHHKNSDSEKDPHPATHPFQSWFWIYPQFDKSSDIKTVKRLTKDPWIRWISKHYFSIYLTTIAVLALINVKIVIYGFFLHVMYAFFSNGLINVVCHKNGSRRFNTQDSSRNNHVVNIFLMFSGIAMHNNHHARPSNASCSCAWYEIDLIFPIINFIRTDIKKNNYDSINI